MSSTREPFDDVGVAAVKRQAPPESAAESKRFKAGEGLALEVSPVS